MSLPNPTFIEPGTVAIRRPINELSLPVINYPAPWGVVTISVQTITPEIADRWLCELNTHNRTLSVERSKAHARDMTAKLWMFAGDTICFADFEQDGETVELLIDGQHRLDAIRQSGMSQDFIIVRGLLPDAQEVKDTGRMRSFGDDLRMSDPSGETITDEKFVSSVTRRLLLWERDILLGSGGSSKSGGSRAMRIATKPELKRFFLAHREEILASQKIKAALARNGFTIPPATVAAAWVLLQRVDPVDADLFIVDNTIRLVGAEHDNHPARQLRQRLTRTDRWRVGPAEGFLLILHAWNLYRDGRTIEKLLPMREWPKPSEFPIR